MHGPGPEISLALLFVRFSVRDCRAYDQNLVSVMARTDPISSVIYTLYLSQKLISTMGARRKKR